MNYCRESRGTWSNFLPVGGQLGCPGPEGHSLSSLVLMEGLSIPVPWGERAADLGSVGWGFVSDCKLFGSAFFCGGSSPWQGPRKERKTWVLISALPG